MSKSFLPGISDIYTFNPSDFKENTTDQRLDQNDTTDATQTTNISSNSSSISTLVNKTTDISYDGTQTTIEDLKVNGLDTTTMAFQGGTNTHIIGNGAAVNCSIPNSTIIGSTAGSLLTNQGGNHIVLGFASGKFNDGWNNTVLGTSSMNTTGTTMSHNVCVGTDSMKTCLSNSNNNVAIGSRAGNVASTVTNNIYIGFEAGQSGNPGYNTGSNVICMGNSDLLNAYIEKSWTVTSDLRDKTDIQDFEFDALSFLLELEPKQYRMNNRSRYRNKVDGSQGSDSYVDIPNDGSRKDSNISIGLIAQDVIELEKSYIGHTVCSNESEDKCGIKYETFVPILIKSIQIMAEQSARDAERLRVLEVEYQMLRERVIELEETVPM